MHTTCQEGIDKRLCLKAELGGSGEPKVDTDEEEVNPELNDKLSTGIRYSNGGEQKG